MARPAPGGLTPSNVVTGVRAPAPPHAAFPNLVARGCAIWYDGGVTFTCCAVDSHPRNTGGSAAPHQSLEEVLL